MRGESWSDVEVQTLLDLASGGIPFDDIARDMRRSVSSVKGTLNYLMRRMTQGQRETLWRERGEGLTVPYSNLASAEQWQDAARRAAAARDLTAELLGDPPRGYSAADGCHGLVRHADVGARHG